MSKKDSSKWIKIGCCGCLGVVLLFVLIVGIAGYFGMKYVAQQSDKAAQSILGAKSPEGYLSIGFSDIQMKENEKSNDLLLSFNWDKQILLIAVNPPASTREFALLQNTITSESAEFQQYLKEMSLNGVLNGEAATEAASPVEATMLHLKNGKKYPAMRLKISEDEGNFYPALTTTLLSHNQNPRLFVMMKIVEDTTDPNANFSAEYEVLEKELTQILDTANVTTDLAIQ